MTDMDEAIDEAIDEAREAAADFLNSEGRSVGHVALGFVVTAGFALLATALASGALRPHRRTTGQDREGAGPVHERPRGTLNLILPAVFSATTLSAVRVWNAPSRPERTRAIALWALAQAVNALWLGIRPATRGLQVLAAMSSAGLAAAFAYEARRLDPGAGKLAAPTGAGVRMANRLERSVEQRSPGG